MYEGLHMVSENKEQWTKKGRRNFVKIKENDKNGLLKYIEYRKMSQKNTKK